MAGASLRLDNLARFRGGYHVALDECAEVLVTEQQASAKPDMAEPPGRDLLAHATLADSERSRSLAKIPEKRLTHVVLLGVMHQVASLGAT